MALLVWFTMGIALWHFTVFLPDHFWQGIVGAFVGAVIGAVVFGLIVGTISGRDLGDTDLAPRCWRSPAPRSAWRRLGDRLARRATSSTRPSQRFSAPFSAPLRRF